MKKNVLLSIIGVLLVIGVGITFAYFTSGVEVSGDGATVELDPGDMIKVSYDAKDNSLNSNNLIPGETLTKTFTVTVTPTAKENTASYSIYLDLTNNTFVKCDDSNYNSITNACIKDYEELTYTFKNQEGEVLSSDNLIGATGRILLASETKTVEVETTYEYTMEIEFHETNADQNHNMGKVIEGNISVEFGMMGSEYILSHYDTVLTRNNFNTVVTNNTMGTIYKSLDESQYDDFGEVYYFAGNPADNWVHFGDFYWRIIRINGDGSIRLIYNGKSTSQTGDETQISIGNFNNQTNNNMYVGFKYSNNQIHGTETNSTILNTLNTWYTTNIFNKKLTSYINEDAGFCGDRTIFSGTGIGNQDTTYNALNRLENNKNPNLKCVNQQDLYTTKTSKYGNSALDYSIGLINADEVVFAGGKVNTNNTNYFLYTNKYYWTLTPYIYSMNYNQAVMFVLGTNGELYTGSTNWSDLGIRPVINLKSDVSITGSGTISDPYEIN